ncbi:MAG: hypothetical protein RR902_00765 [Oscillospiraceae bacterium]
MKHINKNIYFFLIGAVGYPLIEVLWRGFTHPSMAIVGGVCLVLIGELSRNLPHVSLFLKCTLGAFLITGIEFLAGVVFNIILGENVWNYNMEPFNFLGQICLMYTSLWFLLCIPLFALPRCISAVKSLRSKIILNKNEKKC